MKPLPLHPAPANTHGRGAVSNPANRFERLHVEPDPECPPDEASAPATQFYYDATRSIISTNDSPDIGFRSSLNPYRGCEHGCMYCYARPTHEYLGLSSGLDFETKILVKKDAPQLLRRELSTRNWRPQVLAMSGVTDCYQPVERRLKITRGCLEVLAEARNPVVVITKNALVVRDTDLLQTLAQHQAVCVCVSVTTLRGELGHTMEPRASHPDARLKAIRALALAGIPVGVNVAPIIPGLTDYEIPAIVKAAAEAGASFAHYTVVRLPYSVAPLFEAWLARHVPDSKDKVLHRIREMRGGKLYDSQWGSRMKGEGPYADQIEELFLVAQRKAGLENRHFELSTASFRHPLSPDNDQLPLFE